MSLLFRSSARLPSLAGSSVFKTRCWMKSGISDTRLGLVSLQLRYLRSTYVPMMIKASKTTREKEESSVKVDVKSSPATRGMKNVPSNSDENGGKPKREFLENGNEVLYIGPFNKVVRRVKLLSLASCIATTIGTPFLVALGSENLSAITQVFLTFTVVTFGFFTTGPYVLRLSADPKRTTFFVEQLSLLGRVKTKNFPIGSQHPVDVLRPMVNARASNINLFFIADMMKNEEARSQFQFLFEEDQPTEEGDEDEEEDSEEEQDTNTREKK